MVDPQRSVISPSEFKLNGSFHYIYAGAKQSSVIGSDKLLSFSGSVQINADGYNRAQISINQGEKTLVSVMGALVGTDLQVKIPGQDLKYEGKLVESIRASCFLK